MYVNISGGGSGKYANTGSSFAVTSYLKHEDAQRMEQGQQVEPFFNKSGSHSTKTVIDTIDNNKAKLCRNDAKFYVITVSPSQKEIQTMGKTPQEQAENFKEYINNDLMPKYADQFNKGLKGTDIVYFAKIHHDRDEKLGEQMHAHIIVSRKDISNKIKLSPQTNHTGKKKTGTAKGGFNRSEFYSNAEQLFDKKFNHERDIKETYKYQNTMKNGTIEERQKMVFKEVAQEKEKTKGKEKNIKQTKDLNKGLRL